MNDSRFTLFYAPHSRAERHARPGRRARRALRPAGAQPPSRSSSAATNTSSVNPMGKVPAILHNGALITEQPAVFAYLADLFPEKNLRSPRWATRCVARICAGCSSTARASSPQSWIARSSVRRSKPSTCPYGDFDTMFNTLETQLKKGPWILGDRFTAADILWGSSLAWTTGFKLVPATPTVMALHRAGDIATGAAASG